MEFGLCIFILLVILYLISGYYKDFKRGRESNIKRNGIEAKATVLLIEMGENWQETKLFKIQIQVEPVQGRNLVTELTDIPERNIHQLKVGDKLLVKYLPKNPKEVIFVKIL